MIEIELSNEERRIVRAWIESMRERVSHRGDGAAVFPDEAIIENKLDKPGVVRITRYHLREILDFADGSGHALAFLDDELKLIGKIRNALRED